MANGLVLIMLAMLLGAFWRKRRQSRRRGVAAAAAEKNPWHCVAIRCNGEACRAARAKAQQGQRFLSATAPRLPLPGCDAQRCQCSYRHFKDRRHRDDRRQLHGNAAARARVAEDPDRERRRGYDRRRSGAFDLHAPDP